MIEEEFNARAITKTEKIPDRAEEGDTEISQNDPSSPEVDYDKSRIGPSMSLGTKLKNQLNPYISIPSFQDLTQWESRKFGKLWKGFQQEFAANWLFFMGTFLIGGAGLLFILSGWRAFGPFAHCLLQNLGFLSLWGIEIFLRRTMNLSASSKMISMLIIFFIPVMLISQVLTLPSFAVVTFLLSVAVAHSLNRNHLGENPTPSFGASFTYLLLGLILLLAFPPGEEPDILFFNCALVFISFVFLFVPRFISSQEENENSSLLNGVGSYFFLVVFTPYFSVSLATWAIFLVLLQPLLRDEEPENSKYYKSMTPLAAFWMMAGGGPFESLLLIGLLIMSYCWHKNLSQSRDSVAGMMAHVILLMAILTAPGILGLKIGALALALFSQLLAAAHGFWLMKRFEVDGLCVPIFSLWFYHQSELLSGVHINDFYFFSQSSMKVLILSIIPAGFTYYCARISQEDWKYFLFGAILSAVAFPFFPRPWSFIYLALFFAILSTLLARRFQSINVYRAISDIWILLGTAYAIIHLPQINELRGFHSWDLVMPMLSLYFLFRAYYEDAENHVVIAAFFLLFEYVLLMERSIVGMDLLSAYAAIGFCYFLILCYPLLSERYAVFTRGLINVGRLLPPFVVALADLQGSGVFLTLLAGLSYELGPRDSKISTRVRGLTSILFYDFFAYLYLWDLAFGVELVFLVFGATLTWYSRRQRDFFDGQTYGFLNLAGNLLMLSGAGYQFIASHDAKSLLVLWCVCALAGLVALWTKSRHQFFLTGAAFCLSVVTFVIVQVVRHLTWGIPSMLFLGVILLIVGILVDRFREDIKDFANAFQARFAA